MIPERNIAPFMKQCYTRWISCCRVWKFELDTWFNLLDYTVLVLKAIVNLELVLYFFPNFCLITSFRDYKTFVRYCLNTDFPTIIWKNVRNLGELPVKVFGCRPNFKLLNLDLSWKVIQLVNSDKSFSVGSEVEANNLRLRLAKHTHWVFLLDFKPIYDVILL